MMYQTIKNKVMALLLVLIMVLSMVPVTAMAAQESNELTVVVSLEGLTLGQGFYVEPTAYTLEKINALLAPQGYGPYTKETLTAAMVMYAMFLDKGIGYTIDYGTWENGAYLTGVKNVTTGDVDIPAYITDKGGPSNSDYTTDNDTEVKALDYGSQSGWMYAVNDTSASVGCTSYTFTSGGYGDNIHVLRLQYTVHGYGQDLGYSGWGPAPDYSPVPAFITCANKDRLFITYAMSDNTAAKTAALPVMKNMEATQVAVDAARATLGNSVDTTPIGPGSGGTPTTPTVPQGMSEALQGTMSTLASTISAPVFGNEWTVMGLARSGYYTKNSNYFTNYYANVVAQVNEKAAAVNMNGALSETNSTDNSRLILGLTSIGKDATKVGNWNLIKPYEDFTWISQQGLNAVAYALLALDSHNYQTTDTTIRQQCVNAILNAQLDDGGWNYYGDTYDPDMTAIALQALAPYKTQSAVAAAANRAFARLSTAQNASGGYASYGTENAASAAQVIVACTAWGIDPDTNSLFMKSGGSVVDSLLTFYDADAKAFVYGGTVDMAFSTNQAGYALAAYSRYLNGKTSLYDMTDVSFGSTYYDNDNGGSDDSGSKQIKSAKTGDFGVALYAGLALSSVLGMGYTTRRKRTVR